MKKLLIAKIQKYGHIAPGFFIHVLAFLLYGKQAFKSRVHWGTQLGDTLSLSPEEALDRLARKAGVSKREIEDSKLHVIIEREFLERNTPTRADRDAQQKTLEANIANSVGKTWKQNL